jgi:hypothetical protein
MFAFSLGRAINNITSRINNITIWRNEMSTGTDREKKRVDSLYESLSTVTGRLTGNTDGDKEEAVSDAQMLALSRAASDLSCEIRASREQKFDHKMREKRLALDREVNNLRKDSEAVEDDQ